MNKAIRRELCIRQHSWVRPPLALPQLGPCSSDGVVVINTTRTGAFESPSGGTRETHPLSSTHAWDEHLEANADRAQMFNEHLSFGKLNQSAWGCTRQLPCLGFSAFICSTRGLDEVDTD